MGQLGSQVQAKRWSSSALSVAAPQAAVDSGAAPPPQITQQALHLMSVRPGLRIVGTLVDEHLAMDPPRGGIVADSTPAGELAETWDKARAFSRR